MVACDLILVFGSDAGEDASGVADGGRPENECAQRANGAAGGDGGEKCGVTRCGSSEPDQHSSMHSTPDDISSSAPDDRTSPGGGNAPDMMEAGSATRGESENELPVHSLILRLCSPLFDAMLQSDMQESKSSRVAVKVCSKAEFEEFYNSVLPFGHLNSRLTPENVDSMLAISDFYQVGPLRSECAAFMSTVPATLPRLVLAWKLGLAEQYGEFLAQLAPTLDRADALRLSAYPDIAVDMMLQMRRHTGSRCDTCDKLRGMKEKLREATQVAYQKIPGAARHNGNSADEFVRDAFGKVLDLLD